MFVWHSSWVIILPCFCIVPLFFLRPHRNSCMMYACLYVSIWLNICVKLGCILSAPRSFTSVDLSRGRIHGGPHGRAYGAIGLPPLAKSKAVPGFVGFRLIGWIFGLQLFVETGGVVHWTHKKLNFAEGSTAASFLT